MPRWCVSLAGCVRRHPLGVAVVLLLLGLAGAGGWRHLGAFRHYRAARRCLEERDFDRALEHLDACLDVWPSSATGHLLAARAARGAGQPTDADNHLEACQRLGGPAERIVLERYLLRAREGDLAEVEKKLLSFVRRRDADTPLILDVLTECWLHAFRLEEARVHLDLWLELQPGNREAVVRRAWLDERLFRFDEAIDGYRQALEQAPERDRREKDRVRLRLAELLLKRYQPREALEHFQVVQERQPRNRAAVLGMARCRQALGQAEQAAALLDGLLAEGERSAAVLGERGRLALEAGQTVRAESWLRQAAALRPRDRRIVNDLHTCLQRNGHQAEAATLQKRLAAIRADEKEMARLMAALMRALDDASLRQQIGAIFLRNGMRDDGRRWLLSALALDPWHAASHEALARDHEAHGETEQARPHRLVLKQLGGAGASSPLP